MNKAHNTLHWFFAITTSIIIYTLFLFSFAPIKLSNHSQNSSNANKIYMLPVSSHDSKQDKNLIDWMNLENPTLIIQPNREFNYSRIIGRKYEFKILSTETSMDFYNEEEKDIFKNLKINKIHLPQIMSKEGIVKYELFSQTMLPEFTYKISHLKTIYPNFTDYYTGENIPVKFPDSLKIKSLITEYKPISYTLLQINCSNEINIFPNVKLLQSSGSNELDKLAIDNIITETIYETNLFNTGKTMRIVVDWGKIK